MGEAMTRALPSPPRRLTDLEREVLFQSRRSRRRGFQAEPPFRCARACFVEMLALYDDRGGAIRPSTLRARARARAEREPRTTRGAPGC